MKGDKNELCTQNGVRLIRIPYYAKDKVDCIYSQIEDLL